MDKRRSTVPMQQINFSIPVETVSQLRLLALAVSVRNGEATPYTNLIREAIDLYLADRT
jgi:D-ribose pyranose/furanose isomerase RbsD